MFESAKKAISFWRRRGTKLLIRRILQEFSSGHDLEGLQGLDVARGGVKSSDFSRDRFLMAAPMTTYSKVARGEGCRVNIVTDSVQAGSLFGGVGTSLLFGVFLANRLDAQLRIVTRTERPDETGVFNFLKLYRLNLENELQFKFEPCDGHGYGVDFTENDFFVTTSWWTTASTLSGVRADKIIYLLQEDERMFYPLGDDWVKCSQVMSNDKITFVINTKLLYDHLVGEGFTNIPKNGFWFEPSFPLEVYHSEAKSEGGGRKKFFFYARPNNPRNLFYLGIEVIDQALKNGVLDPEEWDILFVGSNIPDIELFGGVRPIKYEKLPWGEYSALLRSVDVGLSLMSTPHPSYPPLDLAASGAVVVTNKFALKTDLSGYSKNIICSELDVDDIVSAIGLAIELSADDSARSRNYMNSGFSRSWEQSFEPVIDSIVGEGHAYN
ncbi:MAG TPA: hypothetical protein VMV35_07920 [Halothiobacillus sp.]|nr:hypothetical protein [Halothiobacillus sp.]